MSQILIDKANRLRDSGKTKEAIKILTTLLKSRNYQVAINATIALGICFSNEGDYKKAIELYKKAIALCEKNGWLERLGSIYRDMAIASKSNGDFDEAEEYFRKSIELMKKHSDEGQGLNASIGITYSKMGSFYLEKKDMKKAEKSFKTGQRMLKKGNHAYWRLMNDIDYAGFLFAKKEFTKAKKILEKAIPEAIAQEKEYFLVKALTLLGNIEKALKNLEKAEMFYSMARITIEKVFDSEKVKKIFLKKLKGN